MNGETTTKSTCSNQTCDYKDTTFENTFCKTMAHIIAIALAVFIIWHAVPGSSKIHQLC